MCEEHSHMHEMSRRTWIRRAATGVIAAWGAIQLGNGKDGWGISIGTPVPTAEAQAVPPLVYRAMTQLGAAPGTVPINDSVDVRAYVLVRGNEATVVDTLTRGNADLIGQALAQAGLDFSNVRNIIATHMHGDHVGSLEAVADLAPQATIWAGAPDIPRITLNRSIRPAGNGDEIFGLRIIETPGHTPGHISVFEPLTSTLFTGDAVSNRGGIMSVLAGAPDVGQALSTINRLATMNIRNARFGHGRDIENASAAFAAFSADQQIQRFFNRAVVGISNAR